MKKIVSLIVIVLVSVGYIVIEPQISESLAVENDKKDNVKIENVINQSDEDIKIHYLDVDQADAIVIELPSKEVMLIDAGEAHDSDMVINYIEKLNYQTINYVVGTHPHADHIGGLEKVINHFNIGKIYMPKKTHTSNTYLDLLTTISDKGLKITTATSGIVIKEEENYKLEIIAPVKEYDDLNNSSAVIKLTYYNTSFLFMGDAEKESELDIIKSETDIDVDVLKVGHHGSDTSSTKEFIDKVTPDYAIISVGEGNKYNLPKSSTIDILKNTGAKILRTDIDKTIILSSDGNNIEIIGE